MDDLIEKLKLVLGSTFVLYLKTQAAHWNVEGPTFGQLHDMFGDQYREMWGEVDEIAERIRLLDAYAPFSVERLAGLSEIEEWTDVLAPRDMLVELVADHEKMGELLNEAFHAADEADKQGIADYLAGRITAHAKHRWFLRATAKRWGAA